MHGCDGKTAIDFVEGDFRLRIHLLGDEFCFAQNQRQSHSKTARVGSSNQLLRIGAGLSLKSAAKTVWIILQSAALSRDGTLPVLDPSAPNRRSESFHQTS